MHINSRAPVGGGGQVKALKCLKISLVLCMKLVFRRVETIVQLSVLINVH